MFGTNHSHPFFHSSTNCPTIATASISTFAPLEIIIKFCQLFESTNLIIRERDTYFWQSSCLKCSSCWRIRNKVCKFGKERGLLSTLKFCGALLEEWICTDPATAWCTWRGCTRGQLGLFSTMGKMHITCLCCSVCK